jgi:DNA-binding transcriptional MerR regulator
MAEKDQRYSIGQLAEMCNASVKQIRYLDRKKILVPNLRNQENHYRYYSPDQLDQLAIIKTLRDLGFPFEEIVDILQSDQADCFPAAIRRRMEIANEEIKAAIFRYERIVAYYARYIESSQFEIQRKNGTDEPFSRIVVPKQTVIFARRKASVTSQQLFINRFFELQQVCIERRIATFSDMMAIFHDGYMKQFDGVSEDLETMMPVPEPAGNGEHFRTFGGFEGVTAYYRGHYKGMKDSYQRLLAWAENAGIDLMDVSVEIYHFGPDMTCDSDAYITQIIIPVQGSKI